MAKNTYRLTGTDVHFTEAELRSMHAMMKGAGWRHYMRLQEGRKQGIAQTTLGSPKERDPTVFFQGQGKYELINSMGRDPQAVEAQLNAIEKQKAEEEKQDSS